MISGFAFFLAYSTAITVFGAIYYFVKYMNTKNIGEMDWDRIIQLLLLHIKKGQTVNVTIYGDTLSFTLDSKSFCVAETFIVNIVNTHTIARDNSVPSMLLSFLQKQYNNKIRNEITYKIYGLLDVKTKQMNGSLDVTMNNRNVSNVMEYDIVGGVYVSNNSPIWSWLSHDGSGFSKMADIEMASNYLFNGQV